MFSRFKFYVFVLEKAIPFIYIIVSNYLFEHENLIPQCDSDPLQSGGI
jgi:hypothetical protein